MEWEVGTGRDLRPASDRPADSRSLRGKQQQKTAVEDLEKSGSAETPPREMDPHKYGTSPAGGGGLTEKQQIVGVEDADGNPISALTILSLLERVAGIIDNVQSGQQRMEERQQELEGNIRGIQGDVLKLSRDHAATGGTVDKLLQKTRKVSANVKEVRARVEKQNTRVKKGETEIPSVAVTKSPRGPGLDGVDVEPDTYEVPADLSSDEEYASVEEAESTRATRLKKSEYASVEEAESTRATRLKKSVMKGTESLKAAFSKEKMAKTKENLGTKFHHLGEKVVPPERREKMHSAGERLKQSGERLKENIARREHRPQGAQQEKMQRRSRAREGAEPGADEPTEVTADAKVAVETKRERSVDEMGAVRIREDDQKEE
ncbi:hypothetical protein CRUP_011010 [Coryphaenoides rupestris]|nr:hypothetical protein CRUP_011010 [Coryphaenoides rupestris]